LAVVRINVTDGVKKKFLTAFAQSGFDSRKEFAAHLVGEGLKKLDTNGNPPGQPPRTVPSADGGNKSVEFDKPANKALIDDLKKFQKKYSYLSQPIANRACLFAALNLPQPWN
jgi:hypothetical protein